MHNILRSFLRIAKNTWVIRIYLGILLVSITIYFYEHREILATLSKISHFEIIFLVLILSVISFLCYVYVNFSTYRALGTRISYWQAFHVVAFSRLGVYMPGKVFYATNYYIFSRCLNIEGDKIGKNFVINNALLFFTGGLCSIFAVAQLPVLAQKFLVILPFLMILLIHPRILNKAFSVLMRKISQFSSENITASSMNINNMSWNYLLYLKFIGLYFFLWFTIGVRLFLCILIFGSVGVQDFPVIISASAAGLIIGLLAVFAPAGLGVREGVGAAVLSQIIPLETAVLACILLRLITVITDFVVGGIATVAFMRKKNALEVGNG